MSTWPKMIFRAPGPTVWEGFAHEYRLVSSDAELQQALGDGWHATAHEARAALEASYYAQTVPAATSVPDVPADDAPPTRAELEQKARELNLKFDGRTGDRKLSNMIAAALKV